MIERFALVRRVAGRRGLLLAGGLCVLAMAPGCSWVPDAVNPVEWVSGSDQGDAPPDLATPRRGKGAEGVAQGEHDGPGRGLAADVENARYAPAVSRDPAPTKPLVHRPRPADSPAEPAGRAPEEEVPPAVSAPVSMAPVPPPAAAASAVAAVAAAPVAVPPAKASAAIPSAVAASKTAAAPVVREMPSLDREMRTAREDGPVAPPAGVASAPPPRPDVPDTVPVRRTVLADQYQRRLQESVVAAPSGPAVESAVPLLAPAGPAAPVPARIPPAPVQPAIVTIGSDDPPAVVVGGGQAAPSLTPPRGARAAKGAVAPTAPAASFLVGAVRPGPDGRLDAEDLRRLREVAALQRSTGGVILVQAVGSEVIPVVIGGDDRAATGPARQVATRLAALGVPGRKVTVIGGGTAGGEVQLRLEY